MMKHYQPFMPAERVNEAIVGQIDSELYSFINSFIPKMITANKNSKVDEAISNHADVNIFLAGERLLFADSSQRELLSEALPEYKICETLVTSPYPNDCRLNVLTVGNLVFAKADAIDENLRSVMLESGYDFVSVNQGYAKCSTCVVNEKSIITDDVSINKAAKENGLDSLLIEKGDIRLCGYDYGFIGGASALINKNHLIFFGDITKHKSYEKIAAYLNSKNCKFDYLSNYPLTDIGGLVLLK